MQSNRRRKPVQAKKDPETSTNLQTDIHELQKTVTALEEELGVLKTASEEDVIVVRTVTRNQAKQEIQELFRSGATYYYSDISRSLGIELPLVVEICQELEESGEVEVDANAI